jgi:hypothetical protein
MTFSEGRRNAVLPQARPSAIKFFSGVNGLEVAFALSGSRWNIKRIARHFAGDAEYEQ